ncbi:chaperonin 10-like protein [Lineolata rhizophorae]|uniref:Chaperonin 10-like protein n=1 Tax=Lineolata rhizophorae TaxID=578093 RepID=A0A6A6NPC9_9PEZI|nr:chaperonin 10-like protein [Lineolata rhizophorae]
MPSTSLPQSMRAHLLEQYNTDYVLREIPVPAITHPDDVLVRVDAASYCHTDAVLASGSMRPFPPSFPHVGCHEFAGTVAAVAPQNPRPRFQVGDRVAVSGRGYHACGRCAECRRPSGPDPDAPGFSAYCPRSSGLGLSRPGGFQEFALVDARQAEPIPPALSARDAAPLMCAGLTVWAALRRCRLAPGARLGVVGCGGGLGHLGLQFAAKMGLKVVGVDVSARGLALARGLGTAAAVVDASEQRAEDVRAAVGAEDGAEDAPAMGLDAVLVLPESQAAFDYAAALLKDGGLLVLVSFPEAGFRLSAYDVVFRRLRIEGSLIGSNVAMREMLDFCVAHSVRAETRTYPFSRLNELVKDYHEGAAGKLVLDLSVEE